MIDKTFTFIAGAAQNSPLLFLAYFTAASALLYLLITELQRTKVRIPGFGGPPGLPMIGNLHQIRVNAAEQYRQWAKKYGPVYQIMLGNVPVVVVNSAKSAREIFGANSQALASRPEFYTFHKVVSSTAGTTIGTSPFSESLKRRRKGAASALNKPSVATYIPHIDVETRDFLQEFLTYGDSGKKPVDPMPMIQRLSLSLALTLNWGTRMASQNDKLFGEITHVEEEVSKFRSTTGNLQDYLPLLRLNPFNFGKVHAREMRQRRDVYLKKLNDDLDDRMAKGTHKPCIQANIILDKEAKLNQEELISISLTMLSGGLDTLTTLVAWSMALLAQRPDIQEKALKEIRAVYPEDQILCDANDDQSIPYICALVRELLRFYTVLRLSLPRGTVKDVVYNGHTIPSGSVVFLNAWSCNMDDEVWTDPEVFRPERWLEQPDAPLFTYGLGYRMCAGSLLANREMYTIYLRMLSAFDIQDARAVDGGVMNTHPVEGVEDQTQLVSVPKRYTVKLVPRNETVLRQALDDFVEEKH
ncbi:3-hydroxyphenylacetate 6-hydroxylase [Exophiala viscosa]|uniref:3-hydroxyphenylacetate 6-hydroxylase n=1 Tax=Exophiala viscosa TaxID=2486360 RepID=A0AAN6IAZ2_9EURO|nr:3-hydroxyphenylacetate 6-hydroxylase [Exophiala viscosa]KAI1624587.1 3-hydroxyphenylacetate 6-hydroxylase [Exophiala viscosa]